jgi:hypothetical protein
MKFEGRDGREAVWKDVALGALGGLAGSVAMSGFQAASSALQKRAQSRGLENEDAQENQPATEKAADAIVENIVDRSIPESKKRLAGSLVHYGFGTLNGIAYQLISRKLRLTKAGRGTLYGTGLWAIADEIVVPAARLSKSPRQTPASSHAYALASHLVYGLATDASIRLAGRLL